MKHAQLEEQGVGDGEEIVREAIEEPQMTELMMDRLQKTETDMKHSKPNSKC